MIISASYKTDVPAFYGPWFMDRLSAGSCRMRNAYGGQVYDVALDRESVDGFVFWTRNARPFLPALAEVRRRSYPFIVHYTITGYGRLLEPSVPGAEAMVGAARRIAQDHGPRCLVWRYDPIFLSSQTPVAFHLRQFRRLAEQLSGATDEVVVSFAHLYRKTTRNLAALGRAAGLTWEDPPLAQKQEMVSALTEIAELNGMRLTLCAQPDLGSGAAARCIDADRLGEVAGHAIAAEARGNRPGCLCHRSRDIGEYDTCPHGCAYCYAVSSKRAARRRFRRHDPKSPSLFDLNDPKALAATIGRADTA